eukprot:8807964-Alexandrium_andersonii.AAC.1
MALRLALALACVSSGRGARVMSGSVGANSLMAASPGTLRVGRFDACPDVHERYGLQPGIDRA